MDQPKRETFPCTVRRAATLVPVPWKNGGGTTREIAMSPVAASFDDFIWRVSVAEIARDGAFSDFPGVDRTIVLLDGAGMDLERPPGTSPDLPAHPAPLSPTLDRHALREPYVPLSFDGGTRWHARLVDGPTHDFNLMVRRGAARGTLTTWRGAGTFPLPADSVLLFVAHGTATWHARGAAPSDAHTLRRFDSVAPAVSRAPAACVALDAGAVVLVVGIAMQRAAGAADATDAVATHHAAYTAADTGAHVAGASPAATAS
ncbi:HutD family protein [Robbsia sp. Bb-Pol-6]|uniref:HutD family protein n=2 Tax=Robbsia betulipollinis TaxID=2981849 RepID=A0ABT3ZSI7_9BURK|nr:HutD family protein [Robbsia betulipollinis]